MIYKITDFNKNTLDNLKPNNYSRRIKSNFAAYGTGYDFSSFYIVSEENTQVGMIGIFNRTAMISTFKGHSFTENLLEEISGFIRMYKPETIEFECEYAPILSDFLKEEYKGDTRTEFAFVSKNTIPPLDVNETPALDDVFEILRTCFPKLGDCYDLWIADTSHRVRRGMFQSFLLGNYTTASIQYIVDKIVLVGHVGTIPEERGKFHARKLLYWIGEKLTADGFQVRLFARPNRVSYYNEIGFRECGVDMVLERINIDE